MCWSSLFAEQAENVHQLDHLSLYIPVDLQFLHALVAQILVYHLRASLHTKPGPGPNLVLQAPLPTKSETHRTLFSSCQSYRADQACSFSIFLLRSKL